MVIRVGSTHVFNNEATKVIADKDDRMFHPVTSKVVDIVK